MILVCVTRRAAGTAALASGGGVDASGTVVEAVGMDDGDPVSTGPVGSVDPAVGRKVTGGSVGSGWVASGWVASGWIASGRAVGGTLVGAAIHDGAGGPTGRWATVPPPEGWTAPLVGGAGATVPIVGAGTTVMDVGPGIVELVGAGTGAAAAAPGGRMPPVPAGPGPVVAGGPSEVRFRWLFASLTTTPLTNPTTARLTTPPSTAVLRREGAVVAMAAASARA